MEMNNEIEESTFSKEKQCLDYKSAIIELVSKLEISDIKFLVQLYTIVVYHQRK